MGLTLEVLIRNWHYDEGYPYGYPDSYDVDDWRKPAWVGHVFVSPINGLVVNPVVEWLVINLGNEQEYCWRMNGGWPYVEVRIFNNEAATAFLLAWKGVGIDED